MNADLHFSFFRSFGSASWAATRQRLVLVCQCLVSTIYVIESHLEHLRITCDLMNFYFAFDEYTDVANKAEASKIANDVMDTFRRRKASTQPLPHGKITTMAQQ